MHRSSENYAPMLTCARGKSALSYPLLHHCSLALSTPDACFFRGMLPSRRNARDSCWSNVSSIVCDRQTMFSFGPENLLRDKALDTTSLSTKKCTAYHLAQTRRNATNRYYRTRREKNKSTDELRKMAFFVFMISDPLTVQ